MSKVSMVYSAVSITQYLMPLLCSGGFNRMCRYPGVSRGSRARSPPFR